MVIQVTFLGTGSAIPGRGAANCAYFVRAGAAAILVDCGPAILQQLDAAGVSPGEITHVFITHRHGDHTLGFPMLALWWTLKQARPERLPVVLASATTWESLDALLSHSYGDTHLADRMGRISRVVLEPGPAAETRIDPAIVLRTWPMKHSDWAPVLGGRFEITDGESARLRGRRVKARVVTLAFTGDTESDQNALALAQSANLLVHDASLSATLTPALKMGAYGHSSAEAAAELAQRAAARHLALVHLEGDNVNAGLSDVYLAEATRVFGGVVSIPLAGQTLEF